jgi:desumoylating isopeptidase 1
VRKSVSDLSCSCITPMLMIFQVHRLTVSLAFLLRFSPFEEHLMMPLLEVLDARTILKGKVDQGGLGPGRVVKKDVVNLINEVADQLCP